MCEASRIHIFCASMCTIGARQSRAQVSARASIRLPATAHRASSQYARLQLTAHLRLTSSFGFIGFHLLSFCFHLLLFTSIFTSICFHLLSFAFICFYFLYRFAELMEKLTIMIAKQVARVFLLSYYQSSLINHIQSSSFPFQISFQSEFYTCYCNFAR